MVGNLFPNPFAKQALVAYSDAFMVLQVFGITDLPEPSLDGNILPNPVGPKTYMVMLCYKNGSLTREGTIWILFISLFTITNAYIFVFETINAYIFHQMSAIVMLTGHGMCSTSIWRIQLL